MSRLTDTKQYIDGVSDDRFAGNGISYDEQGNMLSMKRYSGGRLTDNFAYTYNGNQLRTISGREYTYDANGNMVHDGLHDFDITYNILNLPCDVKRGGSVVASYRYSANSDKIGVDAGDWE